MQEKECFSANEDAADRHSRDVTHENPKPWVLLFEFCKIK